MERKQYLLELNANEAQEFMKQNPNLIMRFKEFVESTEFDYSSLARNKWHEIVREAQKEFNVSFDTENDEAVSNRDIVIDQKFWESTKCEFRCEFRMAGGDWQNPVGYFRCQLVSGYAAIPNKYDTKLFCFIPQKTEGNPHLTKVKKGWSAPDGDDDREETNESLCWESLKKYLKSLVDKEIKEVKKNRS